MARCAIGHDQLPLGGVPVALRTLRKVRMGSSSSPT
jgi:hypothetical protein